MIGFGMILVFAGYGVGSYGWVLVQGYNITARQWFSPFHPFVWPAPGTDIPRVPKGHLLPTSSAQGAPAGGGGATANAGNNPVPNVQ